MAQEEIVTLGGGCFWCIEAVFENIEGIISVVSGYSGGTTENPTYQEVCNETTGHAEVVRVSFNPETINFDTVLEIFFAHHDPTTLNRQGGDVGTQYRSVIFYHDESQKQIALETIKYLDEEQFFSNKIVTEVMKIGNFYIAEDYHQSFYQNNPYQPYCQFIINPKMEKLRQNYSHLITKDKTGTVHDI
ncbi:MAG: peptide-methionine (S)-S-oxide reductase MsrA [Dehalococcoidia bacterium]